MSDKLMESAGGLHILQHSLGLDQCGRGDSYRNHFVTGEGSDDFRTCMALLDAGLMRMSVRKAWLGGMDTFFVTDAGKAYVAEHSPPPPKLTASQRRYREWLDISDATGETFIDFCRRKSRALASKGGAE